MHHSLTHSMDFMAPVLHMIRMGCVYDIQWVRIQTSNVTVKALLPSGESSPRNLHNQSVSEWMSEWVSEWVNEWMSEWVNDWMSEWLNEWVSEWVLVGVNSGASALSVDLVDSFVFFRVWFSSSNLILTAASSVSLAMGAKQSFTQSLIHSLTHSFIHSFIHSFTHSLPYRVGQSSVTSDTVCGVDESIL